MVSKWIDHKATAIKMRKHGNSIVFIEKALKIPRSTLFGWFRDVPISPKMKMALTQNSHAALKYARIKASIWHKQQKKIRLITAKDKALDVISKINVEDKSILELALAMLYLGEGFKNLQTGIGNTDPMILKFFLSAIKILYNYDVNKVKCELHLRADQDPSLIKHFWSKALDLPLSNFNYVTFDKRTLGKPTYPNYMGVCAIKCGNVAIQRRLLYLSQVFSETVVSQKNIVRRD